VRPLLAARSRRGSTVGGGEKRGHQGRRNGKKKGLAHLQAGPTWQLVHLSKTSLGGYLYDFANVRGLHIWFHSSGAMCSIIDGQMGQARWTSTGTPRKSTALARHGHDTIVLVPARGTI
jgi:hypothetical protein